MSDNLHLGEDSHLGYPLSRRRKRVSLACEPCRRKKTKCPGEQPVCSHCARLRQTCTYNPDRRVSQRLSETPAVDARSETSTDGPPGVERRLGYLEAQMIQVLHNLGHNERQQDNQEDIARSQEHTTPFVPNWDVNEEAPLPPWDKVLEVAQAFLVYCDCQPLPLFHRQTFLATLGHRDPEIIYAVLALAIRFCSADVLNGMFGNDTSLQNPVPFYIEAARERVIKRVLKGPVEISTLQTLCLLSMIDSTNGNFQQSAILGSLALDLARYAYLAFEPSSIQNHVIKEERRRCFWSICLLRRLHGEDVHTSDFGSPDSLTKYPKSTGTAPDITAADNAGVEVRISRGMRDEGIVAYILVLSETFSRTAGYVKRRGKSNGFLPWSPESEYSKIIASLMDTETRVHYIHRFKYAGLPGRSTEDLQSNRDYWGPWFLNQFIYHAILCLLNHPLLLSLSLRNHRSTIPEIFLQHSSDMISTHTSWIVYFVRFFEEKGFRISDPFLGYCAAVVATIELQLSFTEDESIRKDKQDRFESCLKFVQEIGKDWPHMARMAGKLEALNGAVSASYVPYTRKQDKSLVIDLSRFWEILDYPAGSSHRRSSLFGSTLLSESGRRAPEVSSTTPLPEPTRIRVSRRTSHQTPSSIEIVRQDTDQGLDSEILPTHLDIYGDQYSMLAESFFTQGQDFYRNTEDWFTAGNL